MKKIVFTIASMLLTVSSFAQGTVAPGDIIHITGISLNRDTLFNLVVGDTESLTATVVPADATNQHVSWSSRDESVATVDDAGLVKAIAPGWGTIYATIRDGNHDIFAQCVVQVTEPENPLPIAVTGISLDQETLSLVVDSTARLIAIVAPANATNQAVTWTSTDDAVATVDDGTGLVTAIAVGTATITVVTVEGNGNFSAACEVTVTEPAELSNDATLSNLEVSEGTLTPEFDPATMDYTVSVENTVESIVLTATVNQDAATIEGDGEKSLDEGENKFEIVVTAEDGVAQETYTVTVTRSPQGGVTDVTLNEEEVSLFVGGTAQLEVTVLPEGAENKDVTWSSSDETVATIADGLVTAIAEGTATITVKAVDGGQEATCTVIVLEIEIVAGEPAGANGKGRIDFTLAIPANEPLEAGSFDIELPTGLTLDVTETALSEDLVSSYNLDITNNGNGKWTLSIAPRSQSSSPANSGLRSLRSAPEMVVRKVLDIVYTVAEETPNDTYEAKITDLSFSFSDGTVIAKEEVPVPIKVDHDYVSPTGVGNVGVDGLHIYPNPTSDVVYINNANGAEIKVYNLNGALLHRTRESRIDLSGEPAGIYLLRVSCSDGSVVTKKIVVKK